jgi:hypothetical protein
VNFRELKSISARNHYPLQLNGTPFISPIPLSCRLNLKKSPRTPRPGISGGILEIQVWYLEKVRENSASAIHADHQVDLKRSVFGKDSGSQGSKKAVEVKNLQILMVQPAFCRPSSPVAGTTLELNSKLPSIARSVDSQLPFARGKGLPD